jgi:predicted RNA polymerase sigma factor
MTVMDAQTCEARLSQIARVSHGRLVAILASRSRDIAASEDAVANAYRAALEVWPSKGLPANPEAWLMRAAKNSLVDKARSAFSRTSTSLYDDSGEAMEIPMKDPDSEFEDLPDHRLKLMFAAAHPAIDASIRAPLIMQTVLGLEAAEIARLFCLPVATMAQRLVRAKSKIRDVGIPFEVPDREHWPERIEAVLEAVYGAYSAGFNSAAPDQQGEPTTDERCADALQLADMLAVLLPEEPEALGLAALIAFSASRAGARLSSDGKLVPLDEQDPYLWDAQLVARAAEFLSVAAQYGVMGRFQLEAAVHAVHADRRRTGQTNWSAIVHLYGGLLTLAPTRGVIVARAYAVSKWKGISDGQAALGMLSDEEIQTFPAALVCRAHFSAESGERIGALRDLECAIKLLEPGVEQRYLQTKYEALRSTIL